MMKGTIGYNYDFVNDFPICFKYKHIVNVFPEAKAILTIRNIDDWLNSCKTHWSTHTENNGNWNNYKLEMFGSLTFNEFNFRKVYANHINEVTTFFDPTQLLIMDIANGDGWDKLCPFINVDIPNVTFPHTNKTVDLDIVTK